MQSIKCCLCNEFYLARNPEPIGKDAAAHLHMPAESFVCYWCIFKDCGIKEEDYIND